MRVDEGGRANPVSPDAVADLLRQQTVAGLPDVMAALGPRVSRRTAFRKLKDLDARTEVALIPWPRWA